MATVRGTRESKECSNRGICNRATGVCVCATYDGSTANLWSSSNGAGGSVTKAAGTRADCGFAVGTVSACPSNDNTVVCSGHGSCSGSSTFICSCQTGCVCVNVMVVVVDLFVCDWVVRWLWWYVDMI